MVGHCLLLRGLASRGVAIFRGIPYSACTTGPDRFMPPLKPEPWPGVHNCLSYGHSCPEAGTGAIENDAGGRNEDCLGLRVCPGTPSA
jgi:para-nitrobenzyl esterase